GAGGLSPRQLTSQGVYLDVVPRASTRFIRSQQLPLHANQLAERPRLEWTTAALIRRLGVRDLPQMALPVPAHVLEERLDEATPRFPPRRFGAAVHAHPRIDKRSHHPRPDE